MIGLLNQQKNSLDLPSVLDELDTDKFELVKSTPVQSLRLTKPGQEPPSSLALNEDLNLYKERPVFISSEPTNGDKFYSSIHKLEEQNTIVQIGTDPENKEKISISFFTTQQPYERTQRVSVLREHYECAMVGNDRRKEEDRTDNTLLIALFVVDDSIKSCKLLQFTRGVFANSQWEETPITMALSHTQKGYATKMLNCFLISGSLDIKQKNDPNENDSTVSVDKSPRGFGAEVSSNICVIFDEQITFLDEALHILKSVDITSIGEEINWINCLAPDASTTENCGFLISCEALQDESKSKSVYNGSSKPENQTLVSRC